ncbi:beta-ribofuranosylaminobenzene 5'-phosphate synthase family protein, partial [Candidatus Methylomirabilis sp.]|uniref:beta-ribofuranosylaminobenzene 5'-phosphate synthase family protein n=1 Tax=Candidatus Methylomirabilis sp. TaxID=2032687 RepID=UPI0030767EA1
MTKVTVKAHARLHFGFIDPDGSSGRQFGSIGLAIDEPSLMLEAMPANRLSVAGTERDRVLVLARQFLSHYNIRQRVHISVKTTIPAHTGLGSGTQLALSVAAALARLFSIDADVRELAGVMGRGRRSGIGIAAFERGGFIVDAGRRISTDKTVEGGGWR